MLVAVAMILCLERGMQISSLGMVAAAFIGSLLAMGFVLLLSMRVQKMSLLVVCGITIGYICSAITDFMVTFASDSNIVNLHNWSMGSFSGTDWKDVGMIVVLVTLTVLATFFMAKPIGAYQMGEAYARNMGVNIRLLRILLILLSSLLSGCVTAFAGPISFVGIAVPHLVKQAMKTARPLYLIPGCFWGGAAVTLFCDGIARSLFAPTEHQYQFGDGCAFGAGHHRHDGQKRGCAGIETRYIWKKKCKASGPAIWLSVMRERVS